MRISDWSSDVCSSDLALVAGFGIAKGDRVGIAMCNSPSWIALYMGVLMAGGIACLLNGWWQAEELAEAIADVDCGLVFADPPRAARTADPGLPKIGRAPWWGQGVPAGYIWGVA